MLASLWMFEAGYGIRTRDLNFGKVACCHYTKPARIFLTEWSIADSGGKVKLLGGIKNLVFASLEALDYGIIIL